LIVPFPKTTTGYGNPKLCGIRNGVVEHGQKADPHHRCCYLLARPKYLCVVPLSIETISSRSGEQHWSKKTTFTWSLKQQKKRWLYIFKSDSTIARQRHQSKFNGNRSHSVPRWVHAWWRVVLWDQSFIGDVSTVLDALTILA